MRMVVPRERLPRAVRAVLAWHTLPWAIACYLTLNVVFFWPALWFGAVPLPLLNPYVTDPVWSAFAPPGLATGTNTLLSDLSGFYYPYLAFTIASLRAGQFPLWNPYLFGGMPYFAANQAAVLYPINLLCYGLGPHQFWVVAALLRLVVAGGGTYLLVRRLGGGLLGALLSGGVYMFAAFNVVWLHFAIHNVAAVLPLALWLMLRLIAQHQRRDLLALAGVVAAQFLGGHPETSLFFIMVCGSFAVAWLVGCGRWPLSGACVVLALVLGLGVSAIQWVPTLDLIQRSATLQAREARTPLSGPYMAFAPLGGVHHANWNNLRDWLLLLAPDLLGSPRGPTYRAWTPPALIATYWGNYNELASYVGLAPLPLALAGAVRGHNRRAGRYFGALLVLALLLLYPLPGLARIGYLPLLNVAYGFRFGLGVTLAAAVLSGLGLEWMLTAGPHGRMLVLLALVGLVLLNLAIVCDLWRGQHVQWVLGFQPNDAERAAMATVYTPTNWRLFLPATAGALGVLALGATLWGWLACRTAGALIVASTLLELVAGGFGYNGFTPPAIIYPATHAIRWLQRDPAPFRISTPDGAFAGNAVMTQDLQTVTGLDDLVPQDQRSFINRGTQDLPWITGRVVVRTRGQRLLDLMNARYIVARQEVVSGMDGRPLPLVFQDGNVRIYRNATALPRAYAATTVVQATAQTAVDTAYDSHFDPHRAVVLEEPPPPSLGRGGGAAMTPVPIRAYRANQVELAPDLPVPAVVVLADSFDPDWHVTVDGQSTPLLRANGIFRGVIVPAGRHQVVFRYQPRMVVRGALLSGGALLGCLLLTLWPRRYAVRRTGPKRVCRVTQRDADIPPSPLAVGAVILLAAHPRATCRSVANRSGETIERL